MMAGSTLAITELLAGNSTGLTDEHGESSDWIDIQNTAAEAMSLAGYALTDSIADQDKWLFPDVELGAGEYLVVFASGKDRIDDAAHLHTNFKLAEDGEYLALVAPGGAQVLQEFSPALPR